jgi:hypothetical protein
MVLAVAVHEIAGFEIPPSIKSEWSNPALRLIL